MSNNPQIQNSAAETLSTEVVGLARYIQGVQTALEHGSEQINSEIAQVKTTKSKVTRE